MDHSPAGASKMISGTRDQQTVGAGGTRGTLPKIAGVQIVELGNVLTRSGSLLEIFRKDWPSIAIGVQQVNWVQLNPGSVTDWHRHALQIDHLVGVGGTIRLALWDGRADSPTQGASEVIRLGALRPVLVIVPPGVWHALRNESGEPAGYLNVIDELYDYARPDNYRLAPGTPGVPDIL
ncbi:MAG: cupin domain-containing protein [Reyranellales bacterium]